jgi:hypothetical protein
MRRFVFVLACGTALLGLSEITEAVLNAQPNKNETVRSVFGRVGTVVAAVGDYRFDQIAGQISLAQMPSNWCTVCQTSANVCSSCANITTPGSVETGAGTNMPTRFLLSDGAGGSPTLTVSTIAPVGACAAGSLHIRTGSGGGLHSCQGGAWVAK